MELWNLVSRPLLILWVPLVPPSHMHIWRTWDYGFGQDLRCWLFLKCPLFLGFENIHSMDFLQPLFWNQEFWSNCILFFVNIFKTSYFRDHQNFKSWVFPIKFGGVGKVLDWLFPNSLNVEKGQGLILFYHHLLESNFRWDPYHLHLQMYGYISPFGPALCVKNDILYRSQAKTLFILLMIGFA